MDIVFGVKRNVKIDDVADVLDVDSARGDVCRDRI